MFCGVAALAVLGVVLLVGCGDGSTKRVAATRSTTADEVFRVIPTKAQYIARADAVCTRSNRQLASVNKQWADALRKRSKDELRRKAPGIFNRAADLGTQRRNELRAIPLPRENPEAVRAYLDRVTTGIALDRDYAVAIRDWNTRRLRSLEPEYSRLRATTRALAQRYGFKVCGRGLS
jgi:hypothetical protein